MPSLTFITVLLQICYKIVTKFTKLINIRPADMHIYNKPSGGYGGLDNINKLILKEFL